MIFSEVFNYLQTELVLCFPHQIDHVGNSSCGEIPDCNTREVHREVQGEAFLTGFLNFATATQKNCTNAMGIDVYLAMRDRKSKCIWDSSSGEGCGVIAWVVHHLPFWVSRVVIRRLDDSDVPGRVTAVS